MCIRDRPITDKGIFHFSYGHFYQMPTLRNLYRESYFGAGLTPTVGYSNLKPEKTVLYVSADKFQTQFVDAIMDNKKNDFVHFYQSIDLLIIDLKELIYFELLSYALRSTLS